MCSELKLWEMGLLSRPALNFPGLQGNPVRGNFSRPSIRIAFVPKLSLLHPSAFRHEELLVLHLLTVPPTTASTGMSENNYSWPPNPKSREKRHLREGRGVWGEEALGAKG